jgi:predicted ATPase
MNSTAAPDIFLSYNREDQAAAQRFAKAFQREGFKVWWDTALHSGELYDEVTEAALRRARAVVVLWSKRSVVSRWVRAEATLAQRNGTLAPAMIEPCDRPIMFELVQTADLSRWNGEPADRAWLTFLADVRQLVALGPNSESPDIAPCGEPGQVANPAIAGHRRPNRPIANNLPRQLASIIGRDADVGEIEALLIESQEVMLAGPGGVGKTRLCLEVGRRIVSDDDGEVTSLYLREKFSSGVWLVDLAPLRDPSLIAVTAARALDLVLSEGAPVEHALANRLSREGLLLLLDNCEHLLQPAAAFCEFLLQRCPGVRILATSHEPLRNQGEAVFHVLPLPFPSPGNIDAEQALSSAAVALFVTRARAADSRYVLHDMDAGLAGAICRRLDGLPLAIEMAAARVATLGLETLATHLDERFRILTEGRRTAVPRHQTLRATLEWSHDLLEARQRAVFRRLGIFPADFSMEAARAVSATNELETLSTTQCAEHLVACSLLTADTTAEQPRYRMMETTREYARAQLRDAQELVDVGRRQATFMCGLMEDCYRDAAVFSDARLRQVYGPELENLRAAVEWSFGPHGDLVAGLALLGASEPLYLVLSLISECRSLIEAALPRLEEVESAHLNARVWQSLGRAYGFSNPAKSFECLCKALPHYRNGDPSELGALLVYMGRIAQVIAGRLEESERFLAEGAPLAERSGLPRVQGHLYRGMSNQYANHGDFDLSVAMMKQACAAFTEGGALVAASAARTSLGYMMWAAGDLDGALAVCSEVLASIRAFPFANDSVLGFALGNFAGILTHRGDLTRAGAALVEAIPLLVEPWQLWVIFDHVALLAARDANATLAAQALGFSEASYVEHRAMRQNNEIRARAEAHSLVEQILGVERVVVLLKEGADLFRGAAIHLAAQIGESAARRVANRP